MWIPRLPSIPILFRNELPDSPQLNFRTFEQEVWHRKNCAIASKVIIACQGCARFCAKMYCVVIVYKILLLLLEVWWINWGNYLERVAKANW